ncbi:hypothetical protein GCM10010271_62550 [Streptomyces kurssanovii]|nr:hypothetical protein GCM10010271_62550 [Streptomyces kurssanovii]
MDTVTCVFMGHDIWPYDSCVRTLRRLRTAFPAARRLFICDVVRTSELPSPYTTNFTLGFKAVHALMGDYLPTLDQWHEAFRESGWDCLNVQPTTVPPNGYLLELSPRRRLTRSGGGGRDIGVLQMTAEHTGLPSHETGLFIQTVRGHAARPGRQIDLAGSVGPRQLQASVRAPSQRPRRAPPRRPRRPRKGR